MKMMKDKLEELSLKLCSGENYKDGYTQLESV